MSLFTWNEKFRIGQAQIDGQHQQLFRLADELHAAMIKGAAKQSMAEILSRLISYTRSHFSNEESLMRSSGYPIIASHKQEHDDLTRQVVNLQHDFEAGKISVTLDTMKFLRSWLEHHILGSDLKIAAYLQARAKSGRPVSVATR